MKAPKKGSHGAWLSSRTSEQKAVDPVLTIHTTLSSMLSEMQSLNAPADKVEANWMARGHVQSLEMMGQTMVLLVHPLKPSPHGTYRYWTKHPRLQLQLFSASLCGFVVDIFSMAPEGPPFRLLKDGGEILTIHVDQHSDQSLRS